MLQAGFSDSAKFNRVALTYGLDLKDEIYRKAPDFIFAVDFGGGRKGDEYELTIFAPSSQVLATLKRKITKITQFKFDFVGRKARDRTWPKGLYRGYFALYRTVSGKRLKILETERTIQVR